ncbi:MAG: hypothetical protein JSV58_07485 [Candidatus Bathyarchaeota archaeon]|nr:MAG: hypothetical protein JSV58_07485 [Candidatus Bathyarchaeota archaeon]
MEKKHIALVAALAVVALTIGMIVFVILPSLFAPPVDISGISPAAYSSSYELLPQIVAGMPMIGGSDFTVPLTVDTGTRIFEVERTRATYDGIFVHIFKADSTSEASDTLVAILEDVNWYGEASSKVQTNDWFTVYKDNRSVFFWRSGVLLFGIDADTETTRNNAAEDFVLYLRSLSD